MKLLVPLLHEANRRRLGQARPSQTRCCHREPNQIPVDATPAPGPLVVSHRNRQSRVAYMRVRGMPGPVQLIAGTRALGTMPCSYVQCPLTRSLLFAMPIMPARLPSALPPCHRTHVHRVQHPLAPHCQYNSLNTLSSRPGNAVVKPKPLLYRAAPHQPPVRRYCSRVPCTLLSLLVCKIWGYTTPATTPAHEYCSATATPHR